MARRDARVMARRGKGGRRGLARIMAGAALLVSGCLETDGGHARIMRVKEVVGSMRISEDGESEPRETSTDHGVTLFTKGGSIRLQEGNFVSLEFPGRKGAYYLFGPADLEVGDVSVVKGEGGIHSRARELFVTLILREGVLAAAFEGGAGDRPSIEVVTERASMRMEEFGRFAVMVKPGENFAEAWVRDERGPQKNRLLLKSGGGVDFPPNSVAYFTPDQMAGEGLVKLGTREFSTGFLVPLTESPKSPPSIDRLLGDASWLQVSR